MTQKLTAVEVMPTKSRSFSEPLQVHTLLYTRTLKHKHVHHRPPHLRASLHEESSSSPFSPSDPACKPGEDIPAPQLLRLDVVAATEDRQWTNARAASSCVSQAGLQFPASQSSAARLSASKPAARLSTAATGAASSGLRHPSPPYPAQGRGAGCNVPVSLHHRPSPSVPKS
jgi:hypothetical protein